MRHHRLVQQRPIKRDRRRSSALRVGTLNGGDRIAVLLVGGIVIAGGDGLVLAIGDGLNAAVGYTLGAR
jgi:hypothetical protein